MTGKPGRRGGRRLAAATRAARRPKLPPAAERAKIVLRRLKRRFPAARCALDHQGAYQLLVATILSAQCTDARVNMVTPELFARYPGPADLARARPSEVEEIIRSTGFFRNKTRSLIGMAQAVVADHDGEIPRTMDALRVLPGVGRKTANVVLGNAYGINEGITVDTHVARVSRRLGLTDQEDPVKIERELMPLFPRKEWALLSHLLIFHGRQICLARRPRCGECPLSDLCPSAAL